MATKEKINLLDVIPFRSTHITTEKESDGTVVIAFPRFKYDWMRRFLLPKGMSPDIHVRLEEHGTAVWELIDGKSTVREIIEKLAATSTMKRTTSLVYWLISLSYKKTGSLN